MRPRPPETAEAALLARARHPGVADGSPYDDQGNVHQTWLGPASADCSASGAAPGRTDFEYDDFGNITSVTSPNTGGPLARGVTRFQYDVRGNLVSKQSDAQRTTNPSERFEYTYDQLDRLTTRRVANSSGGLTNLVRNWYDSDGLAACFGIALENTKGRLRYQQDSLGNHWYSYDREGRVVAEYRSRGNCFSGGDNAPSTMYEYTANGQLAAITYPHGRRVVYEYSSANGAHDRVVGVRVRTWIAGGATSDFPAISNVKWEPYGGLRHYQFQAPNGAAPPGAIEYLLGGTGSTDKPDVAPPSNCNAARPSGTDDSGRIRAIWVSRAAIGDSNATGQIFRRTYTWQADQIRSEDTCILSSAAAPRTTQFMSSTGANGYDGMLRLTQVSRPPGSFAATGGAVERRSYAYDQRNNRTAEVVDGCPVSSSFGRSTDPSKPDWLLWRSKGCGRVTHGFSWDRDGRAVSRFHDTDSSGAYAHVLNFLYGAFGGTYSGNGSTFRAVEIGGKRVGAASAAGYYNYWYDADDRRWRKQYPSGIRDEFFYDQGHQLLEDIGSRETTPVGGAQVPIDEYVWLGGRPVMQIRSMMGDPNLRLPDNTGTCRRLGEEAPCGIYFVLTDHIGKPVLMLDPTSKISALADYDPFGKMNHVEFYANVGPYPSTGFPQGVLYQVARLTQKQLAGTELKLRADFHSIDTEGACGQIYDPVWLASTSGTILDSSYGGHHVGRVLTNWVSPPPDGTVDVWFQSDGVNWPPNGCSPGSWVYSGVSLEGYDYRQFQTGSVWNFTPLRFPGQYHDQETDLMENWNRFYDPSIGTYLQPDPLLQKPTVAVGHATRGTSTPTYAYALNNPITRTDPTGLDVFLHPGIHEGISIETNCSEQCQEDPQVRRFDFSCDYFQEWGFSAPVGVRAPMNFLTCGIYGPSMTATTGGRISTTQLPTDFGAPIRCEADCEHTRAALDTARRLSGSGYSVLGFNCRHFVDEVLRAAGCFAISPSASLNYCPAL